MRKFLAALLALAFTASSASATLYPRNTQFAEMEDGWYTTIDFDAFDYDRFPAGGRSDVDTVSFPKVDVRYTFDERYRVGLNIPFMYTGADKNPAADASAIGFGKLGLTLEAQIAENFNFFFNQEFPTTHNPLLAIDGRAAGFDSYAFETGFNWQRNLSDNLTWFAETGFRFDDLDNSGTMGSFIYNNAVVWDTDTWINPSLELTGLSVYGDEFSKTDLRLIPGWITPIGDDDSTQFRIGMPIGLNTDTPNIGIQAGFFAKL